MRGISDKVRGITIDASSMGFRMMGPLLIAMLAENPSKKSGCADPPCVLLLALALDALALPFPLPLNFLLFGWVFRPEPLAWLRYWFWRCCWFQAGALPPLFTAVILFAEEPALGLEPPALGMWSCAQRAARSLPSLFTVMSSLRPLRRIRP